MYQNRQLFIGNLCKFTNSCKHTLDNVLEEFGWSSISTYSGFKKELHITTDVEKSVDVGSPTKDENAFDNYTSKQIDLNEGHLTYHLEICFNLVGSNPLYKELVDSLIKPAKAIKDEKSKTEALIELLKMERDSKRRRINYKNRVHTKNKSHIEIMREVLAEQMSTLVQQTENEDSFMTVKKEKLGKLNPSEELIEIKFPNGNPHLAWKSVLEINNASHAVEKEDKSHFDNRGQSRYRDSGYSKFDDFGNSHDRKEFKTGRNSNYNERKSQFSGTRSKDRSSNSKYNQIKYEEIESKCSTSKDRKSVTKFRSLSVEGVSKVNNHRHKHRDDRNISPDNSCKKDHGYYKGDEYKYSDTEKHTKYYGSERHKRDRSYSVSPKRHKPKKHKRQ